MAASPLDARGLPGPALIGFMAGAVVMRTAAYREVGGYEPRLFHTADEINQAMPDYVVEMVTEALNARQKSVNGAAVLALGVAYKANVGDTRESPALEILAELIAKGAKVQYADPWVPTTPIGDAELKSVELTDALVAEADCVLVLADHAAFDFRRIIGMARLVVDARNATFGIDAPPDRVVRL